MMTTTNPLPNGPPAAPRFQSLYRTLALSLVLPLIVIQVLLHRGISPVIALAVATVFPLIEMAYEAATTKRVGLIAVISLIGIIAGFGLSFATGNAVFALLKDSLFTAVFGFIFLGSLATPRPLIYRLNLDMAGTSPVISVVVIGMILAWTVLYVRSKRAAAARRMATSG
jgi:hypothetical protein